MQQNHLPSVGEFLVAGLNLWMTCPKCQTTVRPWIAGSKVTCDHCGMKADLVETPWRKHAEGSR